MFARPRRRWSGLILTAALFTVAGCSPPTELPPDPPEPGRLIVSASVAGTPIATVVVEVTASDIASPLIFNLTLAGGTASGTIAVPAGSGRTIEVRAYDAAGILTHRGRRDGVDIREGANNPSISISVLSLGGSQPITVQLSSHTVTVGPISATVSLATGPTVSLTATVRDADGNIVDPNGELHWASNAPAIATVSSAGVVTGVLAGSATIMATYRGVGASAAVTVTP